jgi:hypothetical protein
MINQPPGRKMGYGAEAYHTGQWKPYLFLEIDSASWSDPPKVPPWFGTVRGAIRREPSDYIRLAKQFSEIAEQFAKTTASK